MVQVKKFKEPGILPFLLFSDIINIENFEKHFRLLFKFKMTSHNCF